MTLFELREAFQPPWEVNAGPDPCKRQQKQPASGEGVGNIGGNTDEVFCLAGLYVGLLLNSALAAPAADCQCKHQAQQ